MKKRIYIWDKIYNKLLSKGVKGFEIDVRYLQRWVQLFPEVFPKCVVNGNFTTVFNPDKYRWEIWSGKHKIKFNPNYWTR